MAKQQNTFAKRQRETERKRKAAEKLARRRQRSEDAKAGIVRPEEDDSMGADAQPEAADPELTANPG